MAIANAGRTPPPAGMSASDDDGGVPTGGAAGCAGQNCPECSVNQECERKLAGSMCVAGHCKSPAAQCKVDEDCYSRGLEYMGGFCVQTQCRPNPKWRCQPPAPTTQPAPTQLTLPIVDALSRGMVPNVRVVACNKLDLMCMQQVTSGTTGTDGKVKLTVPTGFMGYIQATDRRDYAPAMYFLPTTIPADGVLPNFPLLASGAIINALALALGAGLDPARGHLMLIANDCSGVAQAGIKFSSPQADSKTVQFYVRDQVPLTTAMDTPSEGDGGYLNFPAGPAQITAKDGKTGLELATVSILVRAGFISVSYIWPMTTAETTWVTPGQN